MNTPTNDTAAPVTEDDLAEVERLDAQATPGPWVVDEKDPRFPVTMGDEDGTPLHESWFGVDVRFVARARTLLPRLAAEVRSLREQDRLVSRDHQRLEDRVVQAEAERDRARAVAAQAEALMQDRERLTQQVRDLKDRYDDLRTEAGKAACAPAEEREDACRMLAAALEQL